MAGCMKGLARANGGLYGDVHGDIVPEKRRPVSVENGKIILWSVNAEDIVLDPAKVESFTLRETKRVKDMCSGGGKEYDVDVYDLKTCDGKEVALRVIKACYATVNGRIQVSNRSKKANELVSLLKK